MSNVNYMLLNNSVVLDYEVDGVGKREIISESDPRYEQIEAAIKSDDLDLIPGILDKPVNILESGGVTVKHGIIYIDDNPIPTLLNQRMMEQMEAGFPVDNLLAFYHNLKDNISFRAREFTFEFLIYHKAPITKDGYFIAYKKIRDDWTDSHTGTIDNSIGQVVKMDRSMVDDDPSHTCSAGLHAAAWEYAEGFSGTRLVAIKINPRDVVCVPFDYDGQKMRVCQYEVLREMESPEKSLVWPEEKETKEEEEEICSICGTDHYYEDCHHDEQISLALTENDVFKICDSPDHDDEDDDEDSEPFTISVVT